MSNIDLSREALEHNICWPIISYVADGRHMTEKQLAGIIDTVRALRDALDAALSAPQPAMQEASK